ncbi:alpha/beta hydrolase [Mycobacterium sp. ACS4331]|uniref:alpha/beta fold hydrolase n=1 Tax=Mycobacterium sp. ACS4331 TaxID=1834121 RepID=UPI0007FF9971|nr:alpha/beta hydrolase [Mycobacterium sp. ACS4331]OBF13030.1 alpha/beta hydrolase [Mycobacterium sp. ACS4331]
MPHVTLQQSRIDYLDLGPIDSPHPPVVFVHGMIVDERLWSKVANALAERGYRCLLPRLPLGSHTTPVTDRTALTPQGLAGIIGGFLAALNLDDVTLVGNDTGGGLCQFLIDTHPERIGRLVLTNCDAFEAFPPFPFDAVFAMLRGPRSISALFNLMRLRPLRHSPAGYGLLATHVDPDLTASWVEPARTDPRIAGDLAAMARGIGATDLTHVAPRLHRFTKPVRLVWGSADRFFTPALGRRLAALFPDSAITEVPGARTFVPLDNPGAVVDAIVALAESPATP